MLKLNSNTLATWYEELTHLKRPWCWERLKAGGEGDNRGWDGWMASPTQCTWVWVNSGSWWWTGRPGVLQSMGSQWDRHDWVTELYWKESLFLCSEFFKGVSSQNKIQRYWPSLQRHFQPFFSRSISLIFCYSLNLLIKFQPQDFRLAVPACNILSLDISMVFKSFLN